MPQDFDRPTPTFHLRSRFIRGAIASAGILLALAGCGGGKDELPPASSTTVPVQAANIKVDTFVQAELTRQRIPGLALVVIKDGKVAYTKGYGYANLDQALPATTEQRFQIGSISKQFTAVAVLLLVQDGKMALDDKISKYLSDTPPEWQAITVRQLLAHTSGLPRDPDDALFPNADSHGHYSVDQLLAIARTIKPVTPPGQVYAYSNVGYQLMGLIIEKVSGVFYGKLIQDRIFTPLGMTTARPINFADSSTSATGYSIENNFLRPVQSSKISPGMQSLYQSGAGGIEMSATDLAKWDASLDTDKILTKASRDLMWAPSALVQKADTYTINYGLGWFLSDFNAHPKVYHGGSMYAFRSDYLRYTTDKLSVIVLTNLGEGHSNPETISRTISEMFVPGTWPPK